MIKKQLKEFLIQCQQRQLATNRINDNKSKVARADMEPDILKHTQTSSDIFRQTSTYTDPQTRLRASFLALIHSFTHSFTHSFVHPCTHVEETNAAELELTQRHFRREDTVNTSSGTPRYLASVSAKLMFPR